MRWTRVYLSMGSNIGNKYYYLLGGIFAISQLKKTKVTAVSRFYSTDPVGYLEQDEFLNCAIEIKTQLLPFELLRELQRIELKLKRERKLRWGPRTLDIDIISYGNLKLNNDDLILPHPRYKERNFVLIPLLDVIRDKSYIRSIIDYNDRSVRAEKKISLLISSCLVGKKTSYKGTASYNYIAAELLKDRFEFIETCPEVEGGLGIPRPSAERKGDKVVTIEGIDVTHEFQAGAGKALEKALKNNIKLALLKGKSPSCGIDTIYDGTFTKNMIPRNGITADELLLKGIDIIEVNKDEQ
ncbi:MULTISPECIES: 2-amino-4-hydroxy-6-hydroxymethyldihydropteridine diphosphokinase [Psychrilyobacter]|uniref:2-amino-4-hydroxy-6-hydroxymethyldihydropteridine diphosphokinase n=1 Tax=Psychrilyobacter piezotolerans TaxID=2293438 RepID=A0ABX9KI50_9FUSO|nr:MULTISPECIES: 2-amino-4-hydroxy-6-hydroxymethyldihydropteridine diphosphokinase [Psychrilyobacter]MCS5421191.1 2-amino-4-hydroxy-6-hydroxymethyldihydropteridine diphosphokinase [Psychrilyobacter sp. S5]NDI77618.1 2-amino-4-hydroxy-6-hydroxymethyldihydropteridine diphosphokinase [Psychrilyobacter piezotolerans]RDE62627.1 2-amino-4-hydroxy-6-hydroxymethyldihydropteridine diphosphokinase [Psychrilyobacter sp. S5]REI41557.1 2-amino-4-hydroxy-6-hydroxymethyldihydropteridine diphosphokinase [Psych